MKDQAAIPRSPASPHIINNNKINASFVSERGIKKNTLTSSAESTCCSWNRRRCKKVKDKSPLSPVLMRLNECKCVMRTKLRALINHSPSQQQKCTRNALAFIVSQKCLKKL